MTANAAQATHAADAVDQLREGLAYWNTFYDGYDPQFTWWVGLPYQHADSALRAYSTLLRKKIAPAKQTSNLEVVALQKLDFDHLSRNAQVDYLYVKHLAELGRSRIGKPLPTKNPRKADDSGIPGPARGREGLIRDLQDVLIPYTPEQLIALAESEYAWCVEEMQKASREMGYGDDWKKALEKTKTLHPPPGGQPAMIRDLLAEAVDYLRANDMVTVPEVDVEAQHMIMMTPQRQLVNPFFSLKFHMGQWSPQQAVDFLVDSVGHERENAIAEVRRSFDPSAGYGPLYQAGYLLGAMQLRGLRKQLVDSKVMSQKSFHDEILRQGSMPIALLRLALTKEKLTRDMPIEWEFSGELADR